jgi:hypothetical protein
MDYKIIARNPWAAGLLRAMDSPRTTHRHPKTVVVVAVRRVVAVAVYCAAVA